MRPSQSQADARAILLKSRQTPHPLKYELNKLIFFKILSLRHSVIVTQNRVRGQMKRSKTTQNQANWSRRRNTGSYSGTQRGKSKNL
jgi:hypothetical protein